MEPCDHLEQFARRSRPVHPGTEGCAECLRTGSTWVELRICLGCGHVGCCDSSPGRHASAHFHLTHHPVMRTFEPGESWGWCYVDQLSSPDYPAFSEETADTHYRSPT